MPNSNLNLLKKNISQFINENDISKKNAYDIEGLIAIIFPDDNRLEDIIECLALYEPDSNETYFTKKNDVIQALNELMKIIDD